MHYTTFLTAFFSFTAAVLFAQKPALSQAETALYRQDAAQIAYSWIDKTKKISEQDFYLDKETSEAAYNVLLAIHNSDLPAAKTLTETYQFHTLNVLSLNSLVIILPNKSPILEQSTKTGSPFGVEEKMDNIFKPLGFTQVRMVKLDKKRTAIILASETFYNTPVLMHRLFEATQLGSMAEQNPYADGNKIDAKKEGNKWTMTFRMRFKNCVNKCQAEHFWTFEVENNEVKFINEGGDAIPEELKKQK